MILFLRSAVQTCELVRFLSRGAGVEDIAHGMANMTVPERDKRDIVSNIYRTNHRAP